MSRYDMVLDQAGRGGGGRVAWWVGCFFFEDGWWARDGSFAPCLSGPCEMKRTKHISKANHVHIKAKKQKKN